MPALEKIWADSKGQSMADFNFRTVTSKFNELVYQYPIRIPERYSLVIRCAAGARARRRAGGGSGTCCRRARCWPGAAAGAGGCCPVLPAPR